MKNTHVLHIWKGHTVDTSPHVRGPASVSLSLPPHCSCPPHSTHMETKTLYLNVWTPQYLFDHGQQESYGIDYVAHDAKKGDFRDFIWASLLSSIYLILVAYHASRRVFCHGMSVISCACIDSWSSSKSRACKEVKDQTRPDQRDCGLPFDFKRHIDFVKVHWSNYITFTVLFFVKNVNYLFSGRSTSHQLSNKFWFLVEKTKQSAWCCFVISSNTKCSLMKVRITTTVM